MVADLQRASAPYMPQLRSLMTLPGAQQARADLLKGLQVTHLSLLRLTCVCRSALCPMTFRAPRAPHRQAPPDINRSHFVCLFWSHTDR